MKEANKVLHAHFERTSRLKDKITCYLHPFTRALYGDAIFLTFTFNDATLKATSPETRRRYVARYLKQHSDNFVANIDYGKRTNVSIITPLSYPGTLTIRTGTATGR